MEFKKIAILPKMTGLEWDMHKYRLGQQEMIEQYQRTGRDVERTLESHHRQKAYFEKLAASFSGAKIIPRNDLNHEQVEGIDLIMVFGGDNHTTYAAHFTERMPHVPILPINSDPLLSYGALTSAKGDDIEDLVDALTHGRYLIETWPRLEAVLNNKPLRPQAVSEIYVGKIKRRATSRYNISLREVTEEQKSSGIIIATGAGTTGWYDAESWMFHPRNRHAPKTGQQAYVFATALFPANHPYKLREASLNQGDVLTIQSLKDTCEVALDPQEEDIDTFPISRGDLLSVRLSETPLRVVTLMPKCISEDSLEQDSE
ncbi:NAD(+)/NADH kinase [Candidatus Pacearchaeota archaeon]|nr:NAD(+)/NADH kinase [Candidatus Pacearchaeota archaeon]